MADVMNFAPLCQSSSNNAVTQGGNLAFTGANTHSGTETFNGAVAVAGPVTYTVGTDTYTAAQVSDFAGTEMHALALGGPVTSWTTANRTAGRRLHVLISSLTDATFTRAAVAYDPYTGAAVPSGTPRFSEPNNNCCAYPENFTRWTLTAVEVLSNASLVRLGPFTMAMSRLVGDTSSADHGVTTATTLAAGQSCFSIYAKAYGYTFLRLNLGTVGNAWFNLSTGATATLEAGITAGIANLGNGLYRCWVTGAPAASLATCTAAPASADNTTTYAGDGVSGIDIWGAMPENTTTPTWYAGPSNPGRGVNMTIGSSNQFSPNQSAATTDLTGVTAVGSTPATVTRDTTIGWEGSTSFKVVCDGSVSGQGIAFTTTPDLAGILYLFAHIFGAGTVVLKMDPGTATMPTPTTSSPFVCDSVWRQTTPRATATTTVNGSVICSIVTNSAQAVTFWVDGLFFGRSLNLTGWTLGGSSTLTDLLSIPTSAFQFNGTQGCTAIECLFFDNMLIGSSPLASTGLSLFSCVDSGEKNGFELRRDDGSASVKLLYANATAATKPGGIGTSSTPRGFGFAGVGIDASNYSYNVGQVTSSGVTGANWLPGNLPGPFYPGNEIMSSRQACGTPVRFVALLPFNMSQAERLTYCNVHDPSIALRLEERCRATGGYFVDFGSASLAQGGNLAPSRALTLGVGWQVAGTVPVSLYGGKKALLDLSCFGTNEGDVFASYQVVS